MAFLWEVDIRGISAPCVSELTSIIAEESGWAPTALMATPCAFIMETKQRESPMNDIDKRNSFFMIIYQAAFPVKSTPLLTT